MVIERPVEEAGIPLPQLAQALLILREESPGQFTDELLGATLPGLLRVLDDAVFIRHEDGPDEADFADDD